MWPFVYAYTIICLSIQPLNTWTVYLLDIVNSATVNMHVYVLVFSFLGVYTCEWNCGAIKYDLRILAELRLRLRISFLYV